MPATGAAVERETQQNAKPPFPKGTEETFLEETDTQLTLAHSSYFIQTYTRLIGARKCSSYGIHFAFAALESRQPTYNRMPQSKVRTPGFQECLQTKFGTAAS